MDIIEIILKSEIINNISKTIRDMIMSIIKNDILYFFVWVGIAILISIYLSGKTITKTIHIISFSILILIGLKYIGIL